MINLIKHSAIVSVIAIFDLTNEGRNVIAETFLVFEVWFIVAGLYLVITTVLSLIAGTIETRTKRFYNRWLAVRRFLSLKVGDYLVLVIVAICIGVVWYQMAYQINYDWHWGDIWSYFIYYDEDSRYTVYKIASVNSLV